MNITNTGSTLQVSPGHIIVCASSTNSDMATYSWLLAGCTVNNSPDQCNALNIRRVESQNSMS